MARIELTSIIQCQTDNFHPWILSINLYIEFRKVLDKNVKNVRSTSIGLWPQSQTAKEIAISMIDEDYYILFGNWNSWEKETRA